MRRLPRRFCCQCLVIAATTIFPIGMRHALQAQAIASQPVGFIKLGAYNNGTNPPAYLGLLGNSDTLVSLPLTRQAEFVGSIQTVSGNVIGIASSPNWGANQFVYTAGTQPKHYYALIGSGTIANPKEGRTYSITSNDAGSLTLALNGDDLSGLPSGTRISIFPYWTLNTVFPASASGVSFTPSASVKNRSTQILVPDFSASNINLAPVTSYFFYNGAWRKAGSDPAIDCGDDIFLDDGYFIVRNLNSPTTSLILMASVQTGKLTLPLWTNTQVQADNSIGLPRPLAVSLNDLGLISSGAFKASPSAKNRSDLLLLYDNNTVATNKAFPTAYYYYNGAWRLAGADSAVDHGTDIIPAGNGMIIRKATTADGVSSFWTNSPTY